LNSTKKLILVALIFGVTVFFIEDVIFGVLRPDLAAYYWSLVGFQFAWHAVSIPSMLWLGILVYALFR
jgi:hypothetical protein